MLKAVQLIGSGVNIKQILVDIIILKGNKKEKKMKAINIIKVIILISILISCQTTKYDIKKSELKKNYKLVEYLIDNKDSLYSIFSDLSKVSKSFAINEERIKSKVNSFYNYIVTHKFFGGYDFVDEEIEALHETIGDKILFYLHNIKIKSKYDGKIIWFLFTSESKENWKLSRFHFCNNYNERLLGPDVPCDSE